MVTGDLRGRIIDGVRALGGLTFNLTTGLVLGLRTSLTYAAAFSGHVDNRGNCGDNTGEAELGDVAAIRTLRVGLHHLASAGGVNKPLSGDGTLTSTEHPSPVGLKGILKDKPVEVGLRHATGPPSPLGGLRRPPAEGEQGATVTIDDPVGGQRGQRLRSD